MYNVPLVIFSGCVDIYVSGRVNRNVSTAVSVNGQGTHMPNGCKLSSQYTVKELQ